MGKTGRVKKMVFINETQTTYTILNGLTTDVTGSIFLTLFFIIAFIVLVAIALRIPEEATALIVLPLLLVCIAYYRDLLAIGLVALIYIGFLVAKNLGLGRN